MQRLIELVISKKNEKWLKENGAVEYGAGHYKFIVLMHSLFFVSLITEYLIRGRYMDFNVINYLFLIFFLITQLMRVWVLTSLGKFWNTKIYRIYGSDLVKKGIYKYFKHPNYVIVCIEIFTLPMIFNLYFTTLVFSILNAVMISIRIKEENKALNIN